MNDLVRIVLGVVGFIVFMALIQVVQRSWSQFMVWSKIQRTGHLLWHLFTFRLDPPHRAVTIDKGIGSGWLFIPFRTVSVECSCGRTWK